MSTWTLAFSESFRYADDGEGITFEILLSADVTHRYTVDAKLDTGSKQNSIVKLIETFDAQFRAGKDQNDKL